MLAGRRVPDLIGRGDRCCLRVRVLAFEFPGSRQAMVRSIGISAQRTPAIHAGPVMVSATAPTNAKAAKARDIQRTVRPGRFPHDAMTISA